MLTMENPNKSRTSGRAIGVPANDGNRSKDDYTFLFLLLIKHSIWVRHYKVVVNKQDELGKISPFKGLPTCG